MKIHEYQAKELFARADIAVPRGRLATTRAEAMQAVTDLGGYPVVIKAQIHAGGRGKGGGVRLAHNHAEAEAACRDILGMQLVTPQTGAAGKRVEKILVEEGLTISRELYLAMLPDRDTATIMIMASTQGHGH